MSHILNFGEPYFNVVTSFNKNKKPFHDDNRNRTPIIQNMPAVPKLESKKIVNKFLWTLWINIPLRITDGKKVTNTVNNRLFPVS